MSQQGYALILKINGKEKCQLIENERLESFDKTLITYKVVNCVLDGFKVEDWIYQVTYLQYDRTTTTSPLFFKMLLVLQINTNVCFEHNHITVP